EVGGGGERGGEVVQGGAGQGREGSKVLWTRCARGTIMANREAREGWAPSASRRLRSRSRSTMKSQESFDADVVRAMSRRQFMTFLGRAASAAIVVSAPLGCATARNTNGDAEPADSASIFTSVQRDVIAKIIDGFNPP